MTQTQQSDRILPLVAAPEVFSQKLVGHRYFVELVSKKRELQDSRAVPVSSQILDVVVVEPTFDAIAKLLTLRDWLKDWQIVSYSTAQLLDSPF